MLALQTYTSKSKQMKTSIKLLALSSLTFLLFQKCGQKSIKTDFTITPPFSKIEMPSSQFVFDPAEDQIFKTQTGTKISIAKGSFVYADGSLVTDEVTLDFEEYHTLGEIIASGIPMTYQNGDKEENFVSAGMFKIEGSSKGKEVFIASEKKVTVQLASYQEGDDYDFYSLDTSKGQWTDLGTNKAEKNPGLAAADNETDLKKIKEPIKPQKYKSGDEVIDLEVDYKKNPELKVFGGVMWKFVNKKEGENVLSTAWDKYEMKCVDVKEATFLTTFYKNGRSYAVKMKPVLEGANYARAMASYEKQSELAAIEKQKEEERNKIRNRQAKLLRSFSVSNFGVYNWDRYYKKKNVIPIIANFRVDGKELENQNLITVFLIVEDKNAVIKYPKFNWDKFSYDPNSTNKLLITLPNDKVAVFTPDRFQKLDAVLLNGKNYTFNLQTVDKVIDSTVSLDQLISSI